MAEKKTPDWQVQLTDLVLSEWDKGQQYYEGMNTLYDDIYDMIRGERPEKNYDWQSNVVINKVFQVVWTAIPYIMQKIFGATPIMNVSSFDRKGAWQRESILEFWHTMQTTTDKEHVAFFLVMVMWLLRALLNGVGIMKKTWHQRLERKTVEMQVPVNFDEQGNPLEMENVKRTVTSPKEDWPCNLVINNKDIVFDWLLQPGQSIRQGRFVIHRSLLDLDSLQSSKINYMNLDELVEGESETQEYTEAHGNQASKDGTGEPPKSDIYSEIEVYERVGKLPVYKKDDEWAFSTEPDKDDATMKEMVVAVAKVGDKKYLIRNESNPYGEINYIDMHIYFDEERWQSMGMIEPIKDVQTALNDNINAAFDKMWQELMPPAIVNKYALWDWDTMQYAPQQRWLVGGNPSEAIYFKPGSPVTPDTWRSHGLFDSEIQLTSSITPPMQGMGREKTATTNVLNAQFSAARLDFLVWMIEKTGLIPSAQMDVNFAKKFAHPLTFRAILGRPFEYSEWEEIYKYIPAASSVKLEYQKESEIQQDTQLIQILMSIQNPKAVKVINKLLANIFRNRNLPTEAAFLDEDFYEPTSEAGNLAMMQKMLGRGPSNQNQVPMSSEERSVRQSTYNTRGMG